MDALLGTAKRESVGTLRLHSPQSQQADDWKIDRAMRHAIGWFGYDEEREDNLNEGEGAVGGGGQAPLSENEDLARRLAVVLQPPLTPLLTEAGALEWRAPLLPYQRHGVATLLGRKGLLLADSMGLGKTVQAIAALRILFHQHKIENALLVCPASLISQWQKEFSLWSPELKHIAVVGSATHRGHLWKVPAHVRLVSYDTLRADVLDLAESPVLRKTWNVVVLDEASRIKNRRSAASIACKALPRERSWALTGTPLENSHEDLISLLEFLLPEANAQFSEPLTPPETKALLQANMIRRRKEEVLHELPPKRIIEIEIELPPRQREAYDLAEREGVIQLEQNAGSTSIVHVLELISRLKQLCNVDPVSGESGKLADISERLEQIAQTGQRALVFSQFTDEVFGIRKAQEVLRHLNPLSYRGDMTLSQRDQALTLFRTTPSHKALLLSLRAGGLGLNLQDASYIFHLDRWWNPALEEQAESRAHRMGQKLPVIIYRYICKETIEARIDAVLRSKRALFQNMVDDIGVESTPPLTEEEIFGLFGLSSRRNRHF